MSAFIKFRTIFWTSDPYASILQLNNMIACLHAKGIQYMIDLG